MANASLGWQQESAASGDIWQFPAATQMAVQQSSPSPHHTQAEDDFSTGGKRQEAKKCGVCGDRALGYNFNAITCESCKAFFRRNALKNKEFRCPFQGQCRVDQVTRRFCQKCRLRKCLEIGMKKEWIMTEEEKRRKKQKIEENRARKIGDVGQDEIAATSGNSHNNNNNNNNNNNESNNSNSNSISVISTIIPPPAAAASSSSSSSPSSSFLPMSSSSSKPQAVVVGRIREEEVHPIKVPRLDDAADVHHNHKNHMEDATPLPGLRECDYLDNSPLGSGRKLSSEACSSPLLGASSPFLGSPPPHSRLVERKAPEADLSNVFTMNIKKEVEYSDEPATPTLPPNHTVHFIHHPHHLNLSPPTLRDHFNPTSPPQTLLSPLAPPPPPPCHRTSDTQPDLDQDCDVFSVREAIEILHPEDRNTEEGSSTTAASVLDALLDTAIRAEFSSPLVCRATTPDPEALTEAEHARLDELSDANKGILAPLCEDYNFKDLTNPSLINIINLTEIVIRRLIKMAKRITAFKNLCQEDQIALLKGGCTEMMLLHSVCAYDPDKDSWKIQQDHSCTKDIKLKVLKAAPGNVYEEHKRFVLAFDPEWKQDPHIIFLLCAITLFNPQRQHIIHTDAIRHEQGSYLYLTRRYLESRYGTCAGRSTYSQLLHRLAHLHHLSEDHLRLFLEVNPTQVEPLLIEIFDLKHR